MATIWGHVARIIYKGEGFFVFSFEVDHAEPPTSDKFVTVSGHLYGLLQVSPGISVQFIGDWIRHPKYGKQFSPYGWAPWALHEHGVHRFLAECVDGFSDMDLVKDIVDAFGTQTFEVLNDRPDQIVALAPNETPKRMAMEMAVLRWDEARALSNLSIFLQDYDMSESVIRSVFAKFGTDAIALISDNPYRLVAVDGFAFSKADTLAARFGIGRADPRRMDGAVLWILKREAQQGHLSVRRGDFIGLLQGISDEEQVGFEGSNIQGQLTDAVERLDKVGIVKVDTTVGVYLPELYRYEREGAAKLATFLTPLKLDTDLHSFLDTYEKSNQIDLSEAQREGLHKLGANRVLAVTGLPGTGKTTLVRAMVRLFKLTGMSFALMAPTGIAAKRLSAVTGESAATIHRTFGYDGHSWEFNGRNKFSVGAVIVDECSMVDQELFYRVLDALHPSTLLVLVGDDAQLPSVGPGNVLRQILSCPEIPHVRLTHIFRQSSQSEIVLASHKINKGEPPCLDNKSPSSEFQFVQLTDEDKIVDLIVQMSVKLKNRDANFQVLSPKYDGVIGVHQLNEKIRDQLNPLKGQAQWKAGKLNLREGDRLMIIKNDYRLNVYNGDVGKLVGINRDALMVRVHGVGAGALDTYVTIPKSQAAAMLRLAYAITVHKCQGSEFDTIVMPITRSQGRMLQRNLFYTAITRAKKKVWLIGDHAAVYKAVGNDRVVQRNTVFARSISEALARLIGVDGTVNGS